MISLEKTKFGSITISGKKYKHDVYLYPDGTLEKRDKSHSPRIGGHRSLSEWELKRVLKDEPDVFFIGMGQSGVLPMSEETVNWLEAHAEERDIKIIQKNTPEILEIANQYLNSDKKVAGIFHTTC
jgi:hypothetical protein